MIAGRVTEGVVDVLEPVDVDEHGRGRGMLASGSREHQFGAIGHQRSVGQLGQPVVHRLEAQLLGLLRDEAQRPPATGREDEHEDGQKDAQQHAANQHGSRVAVGKHAGTPNDRGGLHRRAVVQVDRDAAGASAGVPCGEGEDL